MSEGFVAEARVRVVPDVGEFRARLTEQLQRAVSQAQSSIKPIAIPVQTGSQQQIAGIKKQVQGVSQATLGLASATQIQGSAFGRQATILGQVSGESFRVAAAQGAAATASAKLASQTKQTTGSLLGAGTASSRLDAALLGLRTAAGSAAVIGLGATALAAIAVGKALRAIVGLTASFESELNVFAATTGATADEMKRVSTAAEALGADISLPAVSAADAAVAMTELAKAGLSVQDSINGARGVLQLATAAAISNADAVQLAATAINAFGLQGSDAVHVADVLANAANAAQGSISDMGQALAQAAAVGKQVGLSFEDTSTFLTILTKNGLRGSDAGTSLRTSLIKLLNPTKEAAARIKDLGVELRDSQGNLRVDVFQQFANALRNVSPAVRDQTLALIGGQDAIRAFSILGRQSIQTLLTYRAELRKNGTAAEVASARTKGLAGAGSALQSTLQTVAIQLGTRVSPGLADFTNGITASINAIGNSEGLASGFSTVLGGLGSTLSGVGAAASGLAPVLLAVGNAAGSVTSVIGGSSILAFGAAIAALKLYRVAVDSAIASNTILRISLLKTAFLEAATATKAAGGSLVGLRAGLKGAGAAASGLASSFNPVLIGVGLAAAGIAFLVTRSSEGERAAKAFATASDNLASSLGRVKEAADSAAQAQRGAKTGELNVDQAKLAASEASIALANSTAARGSIERRQLEISLAVATQNVTFATQDYKKALDDLSTAQGTNAAANDKVKADRDAEVSAIKRLIAARAAESILTHGPRGNVFKSQTLELLGQKRAVDSLVTSLREEAKAASLSDDASVRKIGNQKALLASLAQQLGDVRKISNKQIDLIFNLKTDNVVTVARQLAGTLGIQGREAVDEFVSQFLHGLPRLTPDAKEFFAGQFAAGANAGAADAGSSAAGFFWEAFVKGQRDRFNELKKQFTDGLSAAFTSAQTAVSRAATQEDVLAGTGASPAEILAQQQRELAAAQQEFDASSALLGRSDTKQNRDRFAAAAAERRRAFEAVGASQKQIASDAESAGKQIESDRKDAATAQVKIFDSQENRVQNLLVVAAGTESLKDDIKLNTQLRAILRKQIAAAGTKIKDLETRSEFVRTTATRILTLTNQIISDTKRSNQALHQAVRDRSTNEFDILDAKLHIAEANENTAAQRKLINAQIANLKERISHEAGNKLLILQLRGQIADKKKALKSLGGGGRFERLELRLQIAQVKEQVGLQRKLLLAEVNLLKERIKHEKGVAKLQDILLLAQKQKELKALQGAKDSNAFNKATFEFLQTQQGFAANLFGNLIPGGATGGLVGGTTADGTTPAFTPPPQAGVQQAAALKGARDQQGFTNSQSSTVIQLLQRMVEELSSLRSGTGHREARHQRTHVAANSNPHGF